MSSHFKAMLWIAGGDSVHGFEKRCSGFFGRDGSFFGVVPELFSNKGRLFQYGCLFILKIFRMPVCLQKAVNFKLYKPHTVLFSLPWEGGPRTKTNVPLGPEIALGHCWGL